MIYPNISTNTRDKIRASEDLLRLIRQMQEMWLFGKLDMVPGKEEEKEEADLVELASQVIATAAKRRQEQVSKAS